MNKEDIVKLFREALSWGMVYGPVLNVEQWEEMREERAEHYASQILIPKGNLQISVEILLSMVNPNAGRIEYRLGSWNREEIKCTGCGVIEDEWGDIQNHKPDCSYVAKMNTIEQIRNMLAKEIQ